MRDSPQRRALEILGVFVGIAAAFVALGILAVFATELFAGIVCVMLAVSLARLVYVIWKYIKGDAAI